MKKIILGFILLSFVSGTVYSQDQHNSERSYLPGNFEKLIIDGNIRVLVQENEQPGVMIKGDAAFIRAFDIFRKNNTMHVVQRNGSNGQGIIIISVNKLKHIFVRGDVEIISQNILQSPALKVHLDATAFVSIANNGKVHISTSEAYELQPVTRPVMPTRGIVQKPRLL